MYPPDKARVLDEQPSKIASMKPDTGDTIDVVSSGADGLEDGEYDGCDVGRYEGEKLGLFDKEGWLVGS